MEILSWITFGKLLVRFQVKFSENIFVTTLAENGLESAVFWLQWWWILPWLIMLQVNEWFDHIIFHMIMIFFIIIEKDNEAIVSVLLFTLKMSLGLIQYSMNVGTIEMYPTALRQTGASLNYTFGCLASLGCPFFVYLVSANYNNFWY